MASTSTEIDYQLYFTYKEHTKYVTRFLVSCGKLVLGPDHPLTEAIEISVASSRTEVEHQVRILPVGNFVPLATHIAAATNITISSTVLDATNKAILLRRQFSAHFPPSVATTQHLQFIAVLEEVSSILQAKIATQTIPDGVPRRTAPDESYRLAEMFKCLRVEDTADSESGEGDTISEDQKFTPLELQHEDEIEGPAGNTLEDIFFDIDFAMNAIKTMRPETQSLAASISDRDSAPKLSVLGLACHESIHVVQKTQEDLAPVLEDFRRLLQNDPAALKDKAISEETVARALQEDELWALLLVIAENIPTTTDRMIASILDGEFSDVLRENDTKDGGRGLLTCYAILRAFLHRPEHEGTEPEQGKLLYNKDNKDDQTTNEGDKWESAMSTTLDICLMTAKFAGYLTQSYPTVDPFTRRMKALLETKKIGLDTIMATRFLLDCHQSMDSNVKLGREYLGLCILKIIGKSQIGSIPAWLWPRLAEAPSGSGDGNLKSALEALRETAQTIMKDFKSKELPILFTNNPLLCGVLAHFTTVTSQQLGLEMANAYGCVLFTAHLYQACRFETYQLPKAWTGLERVLKSHPEGSHELFVPVTKPGDKGQYFKKFLLSVGISMKMFNMTSFMKTLRSSNKRMMFRGDGWDFREIIFPAVTSCQARERLLSGSDSLATSLINENTGVLTLTQKLSMELQYMDIPYLEVAVLSWKTMRVLEAREGLSRGAPFLGTTQDSDPFFVAFWIFWNAFKPDLAEYDIIGVVADEIKKVIY